VSNPAHWAEAKRAWKEYESPGYFHKLTKWEWIGYVTGGYYTSVEAGRADAFLAGYEAGMRSSSKRVRGRG
jgi:hypothetical protein